MASRVVSHKCTSTVVAFLYVGIIDRIEIDWTAEISEKANGQKD